MIRLDAAHTRLSHAEEACEHWTYEKLEPCSMPCCNELRKAREELRLADESCKAGGAQ